MVIIDVLCHDFVAQLYLFILFWDISFRFSHFKMNASCFRESFRWRTAAHTYVRKPKIAKACVSCKNNMISKSTAGSRHIIHFIYKIYKNEIFACSTMRFSCCWCCGIIYVWVLSIVFKKIPRRKKRAKSYAKSECILRKWSKESIAVHQEWRRKTCILRKQLLAACNNSSAARRI